MVLIDQLSIYFLQNILWALAPFRGSERPHSLQKIGRNRIFRWETGRKRYFLCENRIFEQFYKENSDF